MPLFTASTFSKANGNKVNVHWRWSGRWRSRYASLKNQVNPHFLFNNLNSLSALVQQDATKAQEFIARLSKVYRYILDNQQEEIVPLTTEWKFCESWLFLEQLRYGDALQLKLNIDPTLNRFVPPMAVQLLLENALKHNAIDREHPLTWKYLPRESN